MRKTFLAAASVGGLAASPSVAQTLTLSVEIPTLRVAEYHKPYVAIWIEDDARKAVANLDVWYDMDKRGGEGEKWLSDLRTWWRRSGRSLSMPVNGVSGPTQPPGKHSLTFKQGAKPLGNLKPGSYTLRIEAAREVGGRENLALPFQWPPKSAKTTSATGSKELGKVTLTVKP